MPTDTLPKEYQDLVRSGWYQNEVKGSKYSGVPETEQEQAWIIDYMQRTGEVPTLGQANEFMRGVDRSQYQYTPESTMGGLGFKSWEEYRSAQANDEPYGPWSGSLVPQGGLVTTDKFGRPMGRTFDLSRARGNIARGEFITPPQGFTPEQYGKFGITSSGFAPEGRERYYPQYERKKFQAPGLEEVSRAYPKQAYEARVYDYLTEVEARDAPQIQGLAQLKKDAQMRLTLLKEQAEQRELDDPKYEAKNDIAQVQLEYNQLFRLIDEKVATLMTAAKSDAEMARAVDLFGRGYSGADLPYFAESMNATGEKVANLWDEANQRAQQAFEERGTGAPLTGLASIIAEQQNVLKAQQKYPNVRYSLPIEEKAPGPVTQQEFNSYVNSLNIAESSRRWLYDNYTGLIQQWQASGGQGSFIGWLNYFLAGANR